MGKEKSLCLVPLHAEVQKFFLKVTSSEERIALSTPTGHIVLSPFSTMLGTEPNTLPTTPNLSLITTLSQHLHYTGGKTGIYTGFSQ